MATFRYSSLDSSQHQIRLLTLRPAMRRAAPLVGSMNIVSLDKNPVYHALSYTWSYDMVGTPIEIDNVEFGIGPNLETALRHIRKRKENRVIWIDAVCINQKDVKERSDQVQLMRRIFSSAEIVIAWLGEKTKDSNLALRTLRKLTHATITKMAARGFKCHKWSALKSLWGRPFWKRIWIVQEMALGDGRVVVQCGRTRVVRSALEKAFKILRDHLDNPMTLLWEGLDCEMDWFMNQMEVCCAYDRGMNFPGDGQHLEELMNFTGHFLASNARDHVYALLGLTEDGRHISVEPDYSKSLPQVCAHTVKQLVSIKRSLKVLYGNRSTCIPGLSSWMPIFSDELSNDTQVRRGYGWKKGFRASGGYSGPAPEISACCTLLMVDGIRLDKISAVEGPFENIQSAFLDCAMLSKMKVIAARAFSKRKEMEPTEIGIASSAFLQTLVANAAIEDGNEGPDVNLANLQVQLDRLLDPKRNAAGGLDKASMEELASLISGMVRTLRYRCFFTTAGGHIGVGPYNTKVGDFCAILFGADVPFVLRDEGKEQRLVGDCYVHGIMQGEQLVPNGVTGNKSRFTIH